ncbi:MAG: hypothetical protein AAGB13_07185 [Cyanobacteria bacterium P01_F01_bin.33]
MLAKTTFLPSTVFTAGTGLASSGTLGSISLFGFSKEASGGWLPVEVNMLVSGGEAASIAALDTSLISDRAFINLVVDRQSEGISGTYFIDSKVDARAVTTFTVSADESFYFNFSIDIVDFYSQGSSSDANAYYNQTDLNLGFLVFDTTNPTDPILVDYFSLDGLLIPSLETSEIEIEASDEISLTTYNGFVFAEDSTSSAEAFVLGTYERIFVQDRQLAIVSFHLDRDYLVGDSLLNHLGEDVIAGTLESDSSLDGTPEHDKLYSSLGDDFVRGFKGNDLIEGGWGNDWLTGNSGHDDVSGGKGSDNLSGGSGSDIFVGSEDDDYFIVDDRSLVENNVDIIVDFQDELDKILMSQSELESGSSIEDIEISSAPDVLVEAWFEALIAENRIVETADGVRIDLFEGGYILLLGLEIDRLSANDFLPAIPKYLNRFDESTSAASQQSEIDFDDIVASVDLASSASTLAVNNIASGDNTSTDFIGAGLTVEDSFSSINGSVFAASDPDPAAQPNPELFPQILEGSNGAEKLLGQDGIDVIDALEGDDSIDGRHGIDIMYGGHGNDTMQGGTGDDFAFGGADDDDLSGDKGNDAVFGDRGNDVISGGSGKDTLNGGIGDDLLSGDGGNDSLRGESGADTLLGGNGDDTLDGGEGNDILMGASIEDLLQGVSGHNELIGGEGIDTLLGGFGDDVLWGGPSNDDLTGNWGSDTFVLAAEEGIDTITDFQDGVDRLRLSGLEITDIEAVSDASSASIKVISTGEELALLSGVAASNITPADFVNI